MALIEVLICCSIFTGKKVKFEHNHISIVEAYQDAKKKNNNNRAEIHIINSCQVSLTVLMIN